MSSKRSVGTLSALLAASLAILAVRSRGGDGTASDHALAAGLSGHDDLGPYIQGRNRTILFLANCEHGLANVHVATAAAVLDNYPDLSVHYASFPCARDKIARVSNLAGSGDNAITFHQLVGPSFEEAFGKLNGGGDGWSMIHPPGMKGLPRYVEELQQWFAPWDVEEHMSLYDQMGAVIDEVDPAVIVLDTLFRPGFDITRDRNRLHAIVTPNTLADNFTWKQPGFLWRYPACVSSPPPFLWACSKCVAYTRPGLSLASRSPCPS